MTKIHYRMIDEKFYESCIEKIEVPYFGKRIKMCGRPWPCPACCKEQDDYLNAWTKDNTTMAENARTGKKTTTLRGNGFVGEIAVRYNLVIYHERRNASPKITGKVVPGGVYGGPPQMLTLQDGRIAYFYWTTGEEVRVISLSPKSPK